MPYRLSDEERSFQRTVRAFAEQELAPLVREAEATGRFPRDRILPRLAELGLLGIGVPEALGGSGGGALLSCVVGDEIARVCGGFAIGAMASLLAPQILCRLQGGTPNPALLEPLALLYLHIPREDLEDADALIEVIDSIEPPETLAEAVEEIVRAVMLIADVSRPQKAAPKPGPKTAKRSAPDKKGAARSSRR